MLICPVCFEFYKPNENIISLKCGHLYHKECIERWFLSNGRSKECPHCRKKQRGKFNPVFAQFDDEAAATFFNPSPLSPSSQTNQTDVDATAPVSNDTPVANQQLLSTVSKVATGFSSTTSVLSSSFNNGCGSGIGALKTTFTSNFFNTVKKILSSTDNNTNRLECKSSLKCTDLKAAEGEIERIVKELNEKQKLVARIQGECCQLRNLVSSKDATIGELTSKLDSSLLTQQRHNEELVGLREKTRFLESRVSTLQRTNEKLNKEIKSWSELKELLPIKNLIEQRNKLLGLYFEKFGVITLDEIDLIEHSRELGSASLSSKDVLQMLLRENKMLSLELIRLQPELASLASSTGDLAGNVVSGVHLKRRRLVRHNESSTLAKLLKASSPSPPPSNSDEGCSSWEFPRAKVPKTEDLSSFNNSNNNATERRNTDEQLDSDLLSTSSANFLGSGNVIDDNSITTTSSDLTVSSSSNANVGDHLLLNENSSCSSFSASSSDSLLIPNCFTMSEIEAMSSSDDSNQNVPPAPDTNTNFTNNFSRPSAAIHTTTQRKRSATRARSDGSCVDTPAEIYQSGGLLYTVLDDEISVELPEVVDLTTDDSPAPQQQ